MGGPLKQGGWKRIDLRLWAARLLITAVAAWNLECALIFLLHPAAFASSFELGGVPGAAALRGTATLFVMWNVPYLVALWQPRRQRVSLWEALAMQAIGVVGECVLLLTLPAGHASLQASLQRFTVFDTVGILALAGALLLARR